MALIPESEAEFLDEEFEAIESETAELEPTKTWLLDFENGRIGGFIDEDAALRQFIRKAIMTERSKYAIYSDDYGSELNELIGADMTEALLESEVPRMVYETLAYDDRIDDVQVEFERRGDQLFITATVFPANKDVAITEEVAINGL